MLSVPVRALLVLVAAAAIAPAAAARAAERPLVYAVVIDGLSDAAVAEGNAPFISSLLRGEGARATYFRQNRAVMLAETNPNHAAMMSGAYTASSGISGNAFAIYADLEGEDDNEADSCKPTSPEDLTRLPTVTSGENANCPLAEFVFEAIKRQGDPDGLVTAAIFGKAKLGRIFAGRNFDRRERDVDHLWAPCTPSSSAEEREYCENVPIEPVARDRTISDSFPMDEAIRTIREGVEADGERRRPDFTFVNLPNVDNAGHAFGGGTEPYETAVMLADREVEKLVGELRSRGDWERSVLMVLSDHGHDDTPRSITLTRAFRDAGIDPGSFLIVQNGSVDMVYLANRVSPDRFRLLARMRQAALATTGVAEALYREPNPIDGGAESSLDGVHPGWHAAGARTGDLFVSAKPGFRFSDPSPTSNPIPGNHGAPHTLDAFFAVFGGGPLVHMRELNGQVAPLFDDTLLNPKQSENVDVASTVMGLFGLFATEDNSGRFLGEAFSDPELRKVSAPRDPDIAIRLGRSSRSGRSRSVRVSWAPEGGLYDASVRSRGRWKRIQRRSARTSKGLRLRTGRRYRFRVRSRAASGVHSPWIARNLVLRTPRR